jgi:hypothetical protein
MVPAEETTKGPEGAAEALEPTSRKKKRARVSVCIRKGKLLFFPTELPNAPDEPDGKDESSERCLDHAKAGESEGN